MNKPLSSQPAAFRHAAMLGVGLLLFAGAAARAQSPRPLRPGGILVNQDHLWVGETDQHGTFVIDPVTLEKRRFYGSYESTNAIAVDRDGTVFSADGFFHEVVRLRCEAGPMPLRRRIFPTVWSDSR